jgi:hypothetical protein
MYLSFFSKRMYWILGSGKKWMNGMMACDLVKEKERVLCLFVKQKGFVLRLLYSNDFFLKKPPLIIQVINVRDGKLVHSRTCETFKFTLPVSNKIFLEGSDFTFSLCLCSYFITCYIFFKIIILTCVQYFLFQWKTLFIPWMNQLRVL